MPKSSSTVQTNRPRLSICIATLNRARVISETLDSICEQLTPETELVIVDGASRDNTDEIVQAYANKYPQLNYYRETVNSGVDKDFDKAIGYANGEYCWLMTDDDLIKPGALARVLDELASNPSLILVDTEVRTHDFGTVLQATRMALSKDLFFQEINDQFLKVAGDHLSFIASVIIRRDQWLKRDRESYYGSLFVHLGVILQSPALREVKILCQPLIQIRYGNAMWTARTFEIWMYMWPNLVWRFEQFSPAARKQVTEREPWKNPMIMLKLRAKADYSLAEYRAYIRNQPMSVHKIFALAIALIPAKLINVLAVLYVLSAQRESRLGLYDLLNSGASSYLSKKLAAAFPLKSISE